MAADRWFPLAVPRPGASCRLLCLPCAGGGASMYREWHDLLPRSEVLAVQLPGREHRLREPPLRDLATSLAALGAALDALPTGPPLALFGHSLGAMLAFALARRLVAAGTPPVHVFVAAARAPHRPVRRRLHDLPLPALLDLLVRMGGTSPRVVAEPELVALIEPTLRADLWLAENYPLAVAPRLPVPLTVFGGTEDVQVAADELEAWREVAGDRCSLHWLRGGHFFVRDARAELLERVAAALPS